MVLVFEEQNAFARSTNDGNRRPNMLRRAVLAGDARTTFLSDKKKKKKKVGETNFQSLSLSLSGSFLSHLSRE